MAALRSCLRALVPVVALGSAACVATPEDDDASGASAIAAAPPAWSREADVRAALDRTILPWFHRTGRFGEIDGAAGVKIRHVAFELPRNEEKAALVFFPGRTESYVKYAETAWDLTRRGYSVYVFDHRGQGFSDRLLPDREKGHVDAFASYVSDAKRFVDRVVRASPHAKVVAIGHSMGGAILTSYAMSNPSDFAGVVLASPMHGISFPAWAGGEWGASTLAAAGSAESYAISQGPYERDRDNAYSTSDVRWAAFEDLVVSTYPRTKLGGVTNGWLVASVAATRELREQAGRLTAPTLLLSPTEDEIVSREAQEKVCRAAKRCRFVSFPGAKHELFIESDAHRTRALEEIVGFVDGLPR